MRLVCKSGFRFWPVVLVLTFILAFVEPALAGDCRGLDGLCMPQYATEGCPLSGCGSLEVGAARVDVTPDHSVIMGGYGVYFWNIKNCRWSDGVQDPLYATALAFRHGTSALVLIELDQVGLVSPDVREVRDGVAARLHIDMGQVIVASTHTHHAPDTMGLWGTLQPAASGRDEKYMSWMKARAVEAGVQAYQNTRPAKLYRQIGEETELHWNENITEDPHAPIDHTLTVLKAVGQDGKTIATLTNWACHPTTEDMPNRKISSDWVGVFYQQMAKKSEGVHMYVNGAIGGSIQPSVPWRDANLHGEGQGFVWAKAVGERIADKAFSLSQSATEMPVDGIAVRNAVVTTQMRNLVFRLGKAFGLLTLEVPGLYGKINTTVTAVKMNQLRFGTMPGEMAPNLGMQIRQALGGDTQIMVGLGQDALGYILDENQYHNKVYGYEKMLCMGPKFGAQVVEAYHKGLKIED